MITLFPGNPQVILWNKIFQFPGFAKELSDIFFIYDSFYLNVLHCHSVLYINTWYFCQDMSETFFPRQYLKYGRGGPITVYE